MPPGGDHSSDHSDEGHPDGVGVPLFVATRAWMAGIIRGRGDYCSDEANVGAVLPRRAARFGQEGDHGQEKVQGGTEEHLSVGYRQLERQFIHARNEGKVPEDGQAHDQSYVHVAATQARGRRNGCGAIGELSVKSKT